MKRVKLISKKPSHSKASDTNAEHLHSSGGRNELAHAPVADSSIDPTLRPVAMADVGTKDADFFWGICSQLFGAIPKDDVIGLKFAFSFIKNFEPRDHIEAALATQMSIVHEQIMRFARRVANAGNERELIVCETICTKLSRTFTSQMDTLKRYRATSDSGPTVQNVSVRDGGQAIVGSVTQNTAVLSREKIARLEHRKCAPLPPVREQDAGRLMSPSRGSKGNG
jgi:hypothetical protein